MRDLPDRADSGARNSCSSQASLARGPLGHLMASRNPPAVTMSTNFVNRSISSAADSSQASHPQEGKGLVTHRPKRRKSPGKSENATVIGAAFESTGVSWTDGRAMPLSPSSSSSKPYPSTRTTSKVSSSLLIISIMAECSGSKRSGLVTRP